MSLFTAMSFAGTPPGCGALAPILQSYELDLQKSSIKNCTPELGDTLIKLLPTPPSAKNANFLKDRVCSDMVTVESELQQLNLELAVIRGIDKLKITIDQNQKAVKDQKNKDVQLSARGFATSLNTAQSLELLLYSTTKDGKPFATALKEFNREKRLNQLDLSNRIEELCAGKSKKESDACNSRLFTPGTEAAQEILSLIDQTIPDIKQISKWQEQLKIKRKNPQEGDPEYSFIQMQKELGGAFANLDNKDVLTKEQIKAIQKLDEFTFNPNFGFVSDISILKDKKKNKIASDQFFLLMTDAKKRQEYEVQSKLSIAWQNLQAGITGLTDEQKAQCDNAKSLYVDAINCTKSLDEIKKNLRGDTRARLESFLPTLNVSHSYIKDLDQQIALCEDEIKTTELLSTKCFDRLDRNMADVQEKILHLNMIKEKIASQNVRALKFRNFALQKWTDQKCGTVSTSMDMCETPGLLSKDSLMTISDAMKISIVYNSNENEKNDAEAKAKILCEDENDKELTRIEGELCKFFNDTTSDVVTPPKVSADDFEAPIAPERLNEKNKIRDALIQGSADFLKNTLPYVYQNQFNSYPYAVNPYPYNYSPFNYNPTSQMGIAGTIMFNARYYGSYGYYTPTPGYQPYTAFGLNAPITNYTPAAPTNASKYFGF